jgi:nicotinamide mononucleotide transporter
MAKQRDVVGNAVMAALTLVTIAVSVIMLRRGATTYTEAISFVTGAVCVWMTVRENVWNFPIGLANEVAFFIVFARARLFADAGLQVIYFFLTAIGWYLWLYGGPGRTTLRVSFAPRRRLIITGVVTVAMWAGLYLILVRVNDSSPLIDAGCTAGSLASQWLLDRKHMENWIGWFIVDVVYVPLYFARALPLSGVLYAVFLLMCVLGWRDWRRSMRTQNPAEMPLAYPGTSEPLTVSA